MIDDCYVCPSSDVVSIQSLLAFGIVCRKQRLGNYFRLLIVEPVSHSLLVAVPGAAHPAVRPLNVFTVYVEDGTFKACVPYGVHWLCSEWGVLTDCAQSSLCSGRCVQDGVFRVMCSLHVLRTVFSEWCVHCLRS